MMTLIILNPDRSSHTQRLIDDHYIYNLGAAVKISRPPVHVGAHRRSIGLWQRFGHGPNATERARVPASDRKSESTPTHTAAHAPQPTPNVA
jgi:hypothetical protein